MKENFNISNEGLRNNPFPKRAGDAQRIKDGISKAMNEKPETKQSKRVIYAAAAGIIIITGLFSFLSRMNLDVDFYSSSPIAEIEAKQFEDFELNKLEISELSEATSQIQTAGVTLNGYEAEDIINYLSQSEISTYELEEHY